VFRLPSSHHDVHYTYSVANCASSLHWFVHWTGCHRLIAITSLITIVSANVNIGLCLVSDLLKMQCLVTRNKVTR
jgi:hypothetical protein